MSYEPRVAAETRDGVRRFLMSARANHFVADASAGRGGAGEALLAGELFLSSLLACGLAIIVDEGAKAGHAVTVRADASSAGDPDDNTRYSRIELAFRFAGLDQGAAEGLVERFKARCPIYNTVARSAPITVAVHAEPTAAMAA
jgi:uncharacterized OsmC-like protein